MTNPIYYQNQQPPAYSGVSINITNPTMTVLPDGTPVQVSPNGVYSVGTNNRNYGNVQESYVNSGMNSGYVTNPSCCQNDNLYSEQAQVPQYYPPQYYMNNYNYSQPDVVNSKDANAENQYAVVPYNDRAVSDSQNNNNNEISKDIFNKVDAKAAEQKESEKNKSKTKVIALTNEYIMSLENYLNNPNSEIRIMAAKEVLTRLDEDKTRRDDAALNALLNKMLQDPDKLIRILALSALSSDLASGNEYTFELLNQIQQNPNADAEDVLEISQILLNRSATTETILVDSQNQRSSHDYRKDIQALQSKINSLEAANKKSKSETKGD